MRLSDYQERSRATAVYPDAGENLLYPTLGLCGEAGEVAEKVKKMIRDDGGVLSEERRAALAKELGDVLWYVAQLATEAGLELAPAARETPAKLPPRRRPSVLEGGGDDRWGKPVEGRGGPRLPSRADARGRRPDPPLRGPARRRARRRHHRHYRLACAPLRRRRRP